MDIEGAPPGKRIVAALVAGVLTLALGTAGVVLLVAAGVTVFDVGLLVLVWTVGQRAVELYRSVNARPPVSDDPARGSYGLASRRPSIARSPPVAPSIGFPQVSTPRMSWVPEGFLLDR